MKIISKKSFYLLGLLIICLLGIVIVPTYAKFANGFTTEEDVVGVNFSFDLTISNVEEYEEISVDANSYEVFNVEITNSSGGTAYYGIWYKLVSSVADLDEVVVARLLGTNITTSGSLDNGASKTVTVIAINNSNNNIRINIGVGSSDTSTSDIEYIGEKYLITGVEDRPVNEPDLDSGNLIPVYYDSTAEVWKKADSDNSDNSWYDYSNKEWANAVLVSDSTKRGTYQAAAVGTEVAVEDVSAFYVWIPRFKYRVWNISRQLGDESTYAYNAYSTGIEIEWEKGLLNTGNVSCVYDVTTVESETALSDTCTYNETETITTGSVNSNYDDAWYTHPAFTFDGEEKSGFWIGKFETSGSATVPTVLPDLISLRAQTVSEQFTTAKVFQSYGLSDSVDAHMLTNLEWGAVVYLTQSLYGLCDGTSCRSSYINNSSSRYTGRSGGAISGTTELNLTNFYGSSVTSETTKYNAQGYYDYKGYKIDYNGTLTSTKDESKVASTTGNVTGVYDISGGTQEYVMGNMVSSSLEFYPGSAGTSWNGSSTLDSKYYNSYSYSSSNSSNQMAFNRARLGDATAEVVFTESTIGAWVPGKAITGGYSKFVVGSTSWFYRGGYCCTSSIASPFEFNALSGNNYEDNYTFRSAIS